MYFLSICISFCIAFPHIFSYWLFIFLIFKNSYMLISSKQKQKQNKKPHSLVLCFTKGHWLAYCFTGNISERLVYLSLNAHSFSPSIDSSILWNPAVENVAPLKFLGLANTTGDPLILCLLWVLSAAPATTWLFQLKPLVSRASLFAGLVPLSGCCWSAFSTGSSYPLAPTSWSPRLHVHPHSHHTFSPLNDSSEPEASTTRDIWWLLPTFLSESRFSYSQTHSSTWLVHRHLKLMCPNWTSYVVSPDLLISVYILPQLIIKPFIQSLRAESWEASWTISYTSSLSVSSGSSVTKSRQVPSCQSSQLLL